MIDFKAPIEKKTLREFALIMTVALPLLFGGLFPWIFDRAFPIWPHITGGIFLFLGLAIPQVLKPIFVLWMALGQVLGYINSRIILSFMYYFVFTPVSLFFKLIGRDALGKKRNPKAQTYKVYNKGEIKNDMSRPF